MKKDIYQTIKQELKTRCRSTRYFNREFLNTFVAAKKARKRIIENGLDDSYIKDGYIILYHSYDPVYNSKFYNDNSGAYCEFLAVFLDMETAILES